MNYYEVTFTYTTAIEPEIVNDVLAAQLGEIGFESFTENEQGMQGYIPENLYDEQALQTVLATFPLENVQIHYTVLFVEDKDWNEEWEKNYFKPIRIGHDCIIRASFHEPEPGFQYEIIIDPKMAFGTGNHETTYLMIQEDGSLPSTSTNGRIAMRSKTFASTIRMIYRWLWEAPNKSHRSGHSIISLPISTGTSC